MEIEPTLPWAELLARVFSRFMRNAARAPSNSTSNARGRAFAGR